MRQRAIFLDDGGVMNDNTPRGPQWQRLVGEFFPPLLGGTAKAWAEANRIVAPALIEEYYDKPMAGHVEIDYAEFDRSYQLAWLHGMCQIVGVAMPPEEESLDLANRANAYIMRRVRSAYPGAIETIRHLYDSGYRLFTASASRSVDLEGYLEGMEVRECFERLYGADLVNALKESPEYYRRIFADAGVAPSDAIVLDDKPVCVNWARESGAHAILVGPIGEEDELITKIAALSDLPKVLERLV